MSKSAAVDTAVRRELAMIDKFPRTFREILGPEPATPPNPAPEYLGLDAAAASRLLLGVSNRLRLDTPALSLAWGDIDGGSVLAFDVGTFIDYLAERSTPIAAG
jgi:hypothetical protein